MTATGHAVIGTVIAAKIGNPALAIPIAFTSHIIADMFPHWDVATHAKEKGKRRVLVEVVFDVLLGFSLSFLIIKFLFPTTNLSYAFVIIIASQLLDWLMAPFYFWGFKFSKPFYKFQKLFDNKLQKPWGIINQIAILILLVVLAKIL